MENEKWKIQTKLERQKAKDIFFERNMRARLRIWK